MPVVTFVLVLTLWPAATGAQHKPVTAAAMSFRTVPECVAAAVRWKARLAGSPDVRYVGANCIAVTRNGKEDT